MSYRLHLLLPFAAAMLAPALASGQDTPAAAPDTNEAATPVPALTLARSGNSYLNLSLIGDMALGANSNADIGTVQMGGHDPAQRGFTIQGIEMVLDGAVDHYFRAAANIVYTLNTEGESALELEEAYLETLALPHGLQLRAGQYLTEFGRVNTQHPHAWDFVDAPLVTARFLGPDGLRNPGLRLAWLAPTPFYSELFFGVQNSQGETAHSFRNTSTEGGRGETPFGRSPVETSVHGVGDLLYSARYAASVDLSDTQTLLGGISGAWAPNSAGEDTRTQIYGADIFWKWKPANHHKGFPFVSVQAEALFRGYQVGEAEVEAAGAPLTLPRETLWDWGAYAQINYGFKEGWVAGFRADYAEPITHGNYEKLLGERDPDRRARWRLSPALTWFPSEFSRVRVQYNFDREKGGRTSHGVWLQVEFLLGSHGAHKF